MDNIIKKDALASTKTVQGRKSTPVNAANGNPNIQIQDHPVGQGGNPNDARSQDSKGNSNEVDTHLKPGTSKQIANFTGAPNTVGSTLTRIDEDGSASVFTYDAAFNIYVYHCDDGTVQNVIANRHGEWVWHDGRKDPRRAYEIYNPITNSGRKRDVGPPAQIAERRRYEGPCRLSAVMASNGEATKYHYSANGKLVGVITVSGNQVPLGF